MSMRSAIKGMQQAQEEYLATSPADLTATDALIQTTRGTCIRGLVQVERPGVLFITVWPTITDMDSGIRQVVIGGPLPDRAGHSAYPLYVRLEAIEMVGWAVTEVDR